MFRFLRSTKKYKPLDLQLRRYFESNLLWLIQEFPHPKIEDRKILLPTEKDFPISWNNSRDNVFQALEIVCRNMQLDPAEIVLEFYTNPDKEIDMGGFITFMEPDPEDPEAAGLFHPEKINGKYHISIDEKIIANPEKLIATVAHELAHVKLLGEKGMEENDEMLTDLTTAFFGLGIFNANTAFQYYQQTDKWGYSNLGYLQINKWVYVMGLIAFARQEQNPEWKKYLNRTIKGDFENCLQYMFDHREDIFKID